MTKVNYEQFTNLNTDCNLTDFIFYLQDRGAITIAEHLKAPFGDIGMEVVKLHADWLEVAKNEVKELNEPITANFLDDLDKMYDLLTISKEEFLESYSYINEESYDLTLADIKPIDETAENNETQIDNMANLCRRAENLYIEELNGRKTSWNVLGSQLKEAIYDFVRNNYTEAQQDLFNDYCNDLAI